VTLRRVAASDAEQVYKWRSDPSARRYQPLRVIPLKDLRDLLVMRGVERVAPHAFGDFQWIIETPEGDAGWVTVTITSREHGIASLGYTIASPFRGRGYATAAVRTVLPIALSPDQLDLFRLEAVAAVENHASRHVLERNGFQFEGVHRSYLAIDGERVDHARYALLRSDWIRERNDHEQPPPGTRH
jgi:RimJ/RimL family protein N-acetyltransferase